MAAWRFSDWDLLEHSRTATSFRGDDEGRQDLQSEVHVRYVLEEYHLRHDADQRPGNDQHHERTGGAASEDPHPWQPVTRGRDGAHRRQINLQNRNTGGQ